MYSRLWSFFFLWRRYRGAGPLIQKALICVALASLLGCYSQQRRDEIEAHIDKKEGIPERAGRGTAASGKPEGVHRQDMTSRSAAPRPEDSAELPVVVLKPEPGQPVARSSGAPALPSGAPILKRSEIEDAVAAGPGRLLGYVRVRPYSMKRRFLGFQILELLSSDARFQPPYLRRGDVILQINGIRMKQPENLYAALQSLRSAKTLEFDVWRNEKRVIVSYGIEDNPAASPPARASD